MSDMDESSGANGSAVQTKALWPQLLPICYFSAVAVAMAGWLWAIGWTVFAAASWLFA